MNADEKQRLRGLYAIADAGVLAARGVGLREFCEGLRAASVPVVQWRAKGLAPREVLAGAAVMREVFAVSGTLLVMNDRVDLALLAGFGGVHLGQGDLGVAEARELMPRGVIGVSTHTVEEVRVAEAGAADYVAVGPVFGTSTKVDAAAVVGLAGVRMARAGTGKPVVAIGGITLANCASVREAGADMCAVISGMFGKSEGTEKIARDFLRILR